MVAELWAYGIVDQLVALNNLSFLNNCLAWLLILTSLQVGELKHCNFFHTKNSRLLVSSVIVHSVTFMLM